jgi:hypothetical protein
VIPFNLVAAASNGDAFDVPQSTFTAPCGGLYHFDFVVEVLALTQSSPAVTVSLFVNNLSRIPVTYTAPGPASVNTMTGFWQGILEAGDVVDLRAAVQAAGGGSVTGNAYANVLPYPTSLSAWWFAM